MHVYAVKSVKTSYLLVSVTLTKALIIVRTKSTCSGPGYI